MFYWCVHFFLLFDVKPKYRFKKIKMLKVWNNFWILHMISNIENTNFLNIFEKETIHRILFITFNFKFPTLQYIYSGIFCSTNFATYILYDTTSMCMRIYGIIHWWQCKTSRMCKSKHARVRLFALIASKHTFSTIKMFISYIARSLSNTYSKLIQLCYIAIYNSSVSEMYIRTVHIHIRVYMYIYLCQTRDYDTVHCYIHIYLNASTLHTLHIYYIYMKIYERTYILFDHRILPPI